MTRSLMEMWKLWIKTAVAFAGGALAMHMVRQAQENNVRFHTFSSAKIPTKADPIELLFISDIHRRRIADEILDMARERCDAVLIGGDLTERAAPKARTEENLQKLAELAPVFFVRGNNDEEVDQQWLAASLHKYGVSYLDNKQTTITIKETCVTIIGLSDRDYSEEELDKLFADKQDTYTIVLCHYPNVSHSLHGRDVDVMLCGHTHGGQIRVFGFGLEKKGGLVQEGGFLKLVSNGYGTTSVPLRLGAAPEVHAITIKPSTAKVEE
ncbi:hypothetical protein CHH78_07710 [Shouchella clausii]|uniref:Calcineurin-like phosphoesterase domain-containing protein n=2 Tax=Shouchella clausii TaxID=79880 RepID=A0A268RZR9_SHOCL|nr:hypothetical protein CHH76_08465 [Shouchella clausii]PAE84326.1 hypothetical protein CHH78_07710 [Shouchella clausii]PAE93573.1 hypothetical protein CHH71_18135 [Shouchella clausii]PAF05856.1 hypothetical protein CHH66_07685 [Shouchella clausii]PAF25697.1 hypothetical protein CHH61_12615 [Shouchella clausii]